MLSLTPPAIKTILLSLGYKDIQNIPPMGTPKGFNILVKNPKDLLVFRKPLMEVMRQFGPKLGEIKHVGPSKPEYDYVEVSGYRIFAKLKKDKIIHPSLSHGRENEQNFYSAISEYLKEYGIINIEFQVNGRTEFLVQSVQKINKTGKRTTDRSKSDVELVTANNKKIPISLKQIDASGWESPETYWGEKSRNMLEYARANYPKDVVVVPDNSGIYSISKKIALKANTIKEANDLVFGNDIKPNGAVIKQTFESGHFDWDFIFRTLTIECDNVIRDLGDIPGDDWPYFQIRNFENKNPKYLMKGIGILAVTKKTTKNSIVLPEEAKNYINWKKLNAA